MPRRGNNPKRRIAEIDQLDDNARQRLSEQLVYVGSGHHKLRGADYGFTPPANPRPTKSVCDGVRSITRTEAQRLFKLGVSKGMFSLVSNNLPPKYVWSVDEDGEPYEAIAGQDGYHGYRLGRDDDFRTVVLKEWKHRCQDT
jgi:hypothetical protein